jgi:hypothetical protein
MAQVSSIFDEFGMPASGSPMRIGVGVGRLDGALSTRKEARAPHRAAPPVLHPSSTRIQVMCIFRTYLCYFCYLCYDIPFRSRTQEIGTASHT